MMLTSDVLAIARQLSLRHRFQKSSTGRMDVFDGERHIGTVIFTTKQGIFWSEAKIVSTNHPVFKNELVIRGLQGVPFAET